MINLIVIDDFLGYSVGSINYVDSSTTYVMNQKNTYKILRVEKGTVKVTFNGEHILLKKNQCLFIEKDVTLAFKSSENFHLSYIQFSEPYFSKNHDINLLVKYSKLFDEEKKYNKIDIKEKYSTVINHYFDLLFMLQSSARTNFNFLLAQNTLQQIVLLSVSSFNDCIVKFNLSKKDSSAEKILGLFNKSVIQNVRNERNVKFYCNDVGVDYNVLNKLCLTNYGVNIKNYLDLKCLSQIKCKLENTDLTINEISVYFNFSDTSNFLRFFKRLTQMTASQYRAQLCSDASLPVLELKELTKLRA